MDRIPLYPGSRILLRPLAHESVWFALNAITTGVVMLLTSLVAYGLDRLFR